MKFLTPTRVLIEDATELPEGATTCKRLYLDFESTSFEFSEYGREFYKDHRACGAAVTWDNHPRSYYIPVRHNVDGDMMPGNINIDHYQEWLKKSLKHKGLKTWANQGVKFDAHCALAEGAEFDCQLFCTLTHAKLLDTDRKTRGGYGLDALAAWLLNKDIKPYEQRVKDYLARCKRGGRVARDYGQVAIDIMGEYACVDVAACRDVDIKLEQLCPEFARQVWDTETLLTPVLFDMERAGLRVNPEALDVKNLELITYLGMIEELLHKEVGFACVPSNSDHCFELLCNRFGLPVLGWTDEGNPSFGWDVLTSYLAHPVVAASPQLIRIIKTVMDYRDKHTLLTYFVQPYQRLHVDGLMHPDYDQVKETGRLGCRTPNAQQLSKDAKELIVCEPGHSFLSCDYSQIEFRLIAHYVADPAITLAYLDNSNTDFHALIAKMCGIPRDPAKNVNFCIGYGGGKSRVVQMLSSNMDLVGSLGDEAGEMCQGGEVSGDLMRFMMEVVRRGNDHRYKEDPVLVRKASQLVSAEGLTNSDRQLVFEMLCRKRGEEVYNGYHAMIPNLKRETKDCAMVCKSKGFVRTAYGRPRHLPERVAWRGFNSVAQGTAADVIKERTVALAPRYNAKTRELGIVLRAQVHDENLFSGLTEAIMDPRTTRHVTSLMERPRVEFTIPMRSSAGASYVDWRRAGDEKHKEHIHIEIVRDIPASKDPQLPTCDRPFLLLAEVSEPLTLTEG